MSSSLGSKMKYIWLAVLAAVLLVVGWYRYSMPPGPLEVYRDANPHYSGPRTRPDGLIPYDPQYVQNISVAIDGNMLDPHQEKVLQGKAAASLTGSLDLTGLPPDRNVFGLGIGFATRDNSSAGWCLEHNRMLKYEQSGEKVHFNGSVALPEIAGNYTLVLMFYHHHLDDVVIPAHFAAMYPIQIATNRDETPAESP